MSHGAAPHKSSLLQHTALRELPDDQGRRFELYDDNFSKLVFDWMDGSCAPLPLRNHSPRERLIQAGYSVLAAELWTRLRHPYLPTEIGPLLQWPDAVVDVAQHNQHGDPDQNSWWGLSGPIGSDGPTPLFREQQVLRDAGLQPKHSASFGRHYTSAFSPAAGIREIRFFAIFANHKYYHEDVVVSRNRFL